MSFGYKSSTISPSLLLTPSPHLVASFDAILLLLFLLVLALIFAGISVKAFGGLIQISGTDTFPELSTSIFGEYNYYVLCYNDPLLALGSLFVLLMVNNTYIISKGVEVVTKGSACRFFFIAWYILGVLLLLNLFTASILTSFMNFWLARHEASTHQPHHRHSQGLGDDDDDEFVMPTRMTTMSLRAPLDHEHSFSSQSLGFHSRRSEMTAAETSTHRLSNINVKNNSFRMRYSNLDDGIFQWMTNFQDTPEHPLPTQLSSVRPIVRASQSQHHRQMLERPGEAFEMDDVSISRDDTLESQEASPRSTNPLSKSPSNSILDRLTPLYPFQDQRVGAALSESRSITTALPYIPEDDIRDSESAFSEDTEANEIADEAIFPRSRYLSNIAAFPASDKLTSKSNETILPATLDLRGWYHYYVSQKMVSVTIVEYTATLLQSAKNGTDMLQFKSRASYLCYRATKTVFLSLSFLLLIPPSTLNFFVGLRGFFVS